jgi:uncharacterized protein (DUF362 family)
MGITLCLKNLFGLPPIPPHGRVRTYYHHPIRLSYVLPDLGLITQPCLNIIDALTGQSGREWAGEGRIGDTLIAGDHVIATDTCGASLMGHGKAALGSRRSALGARLRQGRGIGSLPLSLPSAERRAPSAALPTSTASAR